LHLLLLYGGRWWRRDWMGNYCLMLSFVKMVPNMIISSVHACSLSFSHLIEFLVHNF
jgi:hypothetical protein